MNSEKCPVCFGVAENDLPTHGCQYCGRINPPSGLHLGGIEWPESAKKMADSIISNLMKKDADYLCPLCGSKEPYHTAVSCVEARANLHQQDALEAEQDAVAHITASAFPTNPGEYFILRDNSWVPAVWDGEDWMLKDGTTTSQPHVYHTLKVMQDLLSTQRKPKHFNIGDPTKVYVCALSETEINTIGYLYDYVINDAQKGNEEARRYVEFFQPLLESMGSEFAPFEDENAPYEEGKFPMFSPLAIKLFEKREKGDIRQVTTYAICVTIIFFIAAAFVGYLLTNKRP